MVSHHASLQSSTDSFNLVDEEQAYDVCYAELERQVLELTAEDEEHGDRVLDTKHDYRRSALIRASKDSRSKANSPARSHGASFLSTWENNEKISDISFAMPTRVSSVQQPKSNGTGVFIPNIVKSRTRFTPENTSYYCGNRRRIYRQVEIGENSKHLLTSWRLKREIRLSN